MALRAFYGQQTTGTLRYVRESLCASVPMFSVIPEARDPDVSWFNIRCEGEAFVVRELRSTQQAAGQGKIYQRKVVYVQMDD